MRITLDLPEDLLRQLKAKAALEGATIKALMRGLVERGLQVPATTAPTTSPALPSGGLGRKPNLPRPSNAGLFELLDD